MGATTATLFLTYLTLAAADPAGPPPALVGEWYLESTADERGVDRGSSDCRMVVEADGGVRFTFDGIVTACGAFMAARAGERAGAVDLKLADTRTLRGVYAAEGDALVLCFDEAGKCRPDGVKPRGTQWVERWRRAPAHGLLSKNSGQVRVKEAAGGGKREVKGGLPPPWGRETQGPR